MGVKIPAAFEDATGQVTRLTGELEFLVAATPGEALTADSPATTASFQPGGGGSAEPFAFVTLASANNYAPGTNIPFDTVTADADGFWDAVNSQFVVPAGKGGVYQMTVMVSAQGGMTDLGPHVSCVIQGSFTGPQNPHAPLGADVGTFDYFGGVTGVGIAADGETINAVVAWDGLAATATLVVCQLSVVRIGDAP